MLPVGIANLIGADLSYAVLSGVDLRGANLTPANLAGANLYGVWCNEKPSYLPAWHLPA